eukprot:6089163-Prymnesium_polylepis.1
MHVLCLDCEPGPSVAPTSDLNEIFGGSCDIARDRARSCWIVLDRAGLCWGAQAAVAIARRAAA